MKDYEIIRKLDKKTTYTIISNQIWPKLHLNQRFQSKPVWIWPSLDVRKNLCSEVILDKCVNFLSREEYKKYSHLVVVGTRIILFDSFEKLRKKQNPKKAEFIVWVLVSPNQKLDFAIIDGGNALVVNTITPVNIIRPCVWACPERIENLRKLKKELWFNSIIFGVEFDLTSNHSRIKSKLCGKLWW